MMALMSEEAHQEPDAGAGKPGPGARSSVRAAVGPAGGPGRAEKTAGCPATGADAADAAARAAADTAERAVADVAERAAALEEFAADVRQGLGAAVLCLPCKYLYDNRGSELFDRITREPEYYQTRTELAILERYAGDIIRRVRPRELVELGSGVGRKVRLLLDTMDDQGLLESCTLFDINASFLHESVERLREAYPTLRAAALHGDFHTDLQLLGPGGGRLVLFLAGTIGNLHPGEVSTFLRKVAELLAPGDGFLLGVDLVKDPARLEAAYDDAAGVTAAFNKNLLHRVNRELGADFDVDGFDHVATWDAENAWVDIRLRCSRSQRVRIPQLALELDFEVGDDISTEISCKFTRQSLADRLAGTGLRLGEWYTDDDELFALALLEKDGC